jgi:hypothetical protein
MTDGKQKRIDNATIYITLTPCSFPIRALLSLKALYWKKAAAEKGMLSPLFYSHFLPINTTYVFDNFSNSVFYYTNPFSHGRELLTMKV